MANTLLGPWSPQYPVDFYEGGDTVTEAFGKHIEEIERIYGLLNALDLGKVTTGDLTEILKSYVTLTALNARLGDYVTNSVFNNHVNSANPHPNMTLPMSKVTGNLDASRVNGLVDVIKQNTIAEGEVSANGYAKFGNGLIIQWGEWGFPEFKTNEYIITRSFKTSFPNACFAVSLTPHVRLHSELENTNYSEVDAGVLAVSWNKSQCRVIANAFSSSIGDIKEIYASYIAIGN